MNKKIIEDLKKIKEKLQKINDGKTLEYGYQSITKEKINPS